MGSADIVCVPFNEPEVNPVLIVQPDGEIARLRLGQSFYLQRAQVVRRGRCVDRVELALCHFPHALR
jgi:hypothetical protein